MLSMIGSVLLSAAAMQAAAPERECRESTLLTADGRKTTIQYCRIGTGPWTRVGGTELPQPPFPYRSSVTFVGTYQLNSTKPGRPVRRLTLQNLMNSGGESQRLEGAITIAARFDGPAATAQISGTGGLYGASFSGLIQNGRCRMTDTQQRVVYEGKCDRSGFSGTMKSTPNSRLIVNGSFTTRVTNIGD